MDRFGPGFNAGDVREFAGSTEETDRTGVYILYGPDPEDDLRMRCYVGEADSVRERLGQSAGARGFWETAVVIDLGRGTH